MVFTGKTALVNNQVNFANYNGKNPINYRSRNCDTNLNSNTPANQYQRLKLIQNTVRVYSSLYSMNLAGLNTYQNPKSTFQPIYLNGSYYVASPGVNWNQMSDRASPHTQIAVTSSGSTYHGSSTKNSIVRLRPGSLSPGGTGCDIKHNSYNRYLNRLKGKGPLRRGIIPPGFGSHIPFNRAYPIYGGKVTKTNIVNGCNCSSNTNENVLFQNPYYNINNVQYQFSIGDKVYIAINKIKEEGVILNINGLNYTLQLTNGNIITTSLDSLILYSNCECKTSQENSLINIGSNCVLPENILVV
jgi:hypothetical protein